MAARCPPHAAPGARVVARPRALADGATPVADAHPADDAARPVPQHVHHRRRRRGLAIIDQHVAHERILFEQIAERLTTRTLESQRLLTPVVLELGPGEHQTLLSHRDALERLGFEVEDFGGHGLRIGAVPALLDWNRSEDALRAVAEDLDGLTPGAGVDEALRRMAATMACHAAVKANDPLTREKMQYLLDELRRTAHSSVCPHGRPVVLRLTRREIEKNFERV